MVGDGGWAVLLVGVLAGCVGFDGAVAGGDFGGGDVGTATPRVGDGGSSDGRVAGQTEVVEGLCHREAIEGGIRRVRRFGHTEAAAVSRDLG